MTLKQFAQIKAKAQEYEQRHTAFARSMILLAVNENQHVLHKDKLLKVLQLVSMAAIATVKNSMPPYIVSEWLEQAEAILIEYLRTYN